MLEHAVADGRANGTLVVPIAAAAAADRAFADWLVETVSARPERGRRGWCSRCPRRRRSPTSPPSARWPPASASSAGRLALDQFGRVGAFALLKALPVHHVRLDAGLVRGLPGSDRDRAVVLALVHAAEALGAITVATGVDGEAELTAVRGFGIGLAEGDGAASA